MDELDEKGDIRNVPRHIMKELISTYKAHPALWQIKNKDVYGNRSLKYKGHQALVQVWKKHDDDADIKMVKNKIQSIRGSFRKELKKIQHSQKSGNGTEDIYKSQLWYFSMMSFLTDHEQPTASVDNLEELTHSETQQDNIDVDDATTSTNNNDGTASQATEIPIADTNRYEPTKKKKKVEDEKRKFLKACTEALGNKEETENDAFGKFISKKFTKITNSEQRMYAEALIIKVANYAILNKLNELSDIIGNYSLLRDTNTPLSNYSSSTSVSAAHQPTITYPENSTAMAMEGPAAAVSTDTPADFSPNLCAYYENVACYETIYSEDH